VIRRVTSYVTPRCRRSVLPRFGMWGNLVALCCDVSYHCCYFCGIYAAKTSHFMLHFSYKVVWPDTFVKHSILVIVSFTVCRHGLVSASIRPMSGFE